MSAYRATSTRLEELRSHERELLLKYTKGYPLVQSVNVQIKQVAQEKADLEKEYPALALAAAGSGSGGTDTAGSRSTDSAQVDFQLQPAETAESTASGPEAQALGETVRRGSEAWKSGDYSKAFGLLLPAALKGDPIAQHRVGVMYVRGDGVGVDHAEATRWFRSAAEQGQAESQYSMALRYQRGESVAQDHQEAARWFKLAADQGIGAAAAALGREYAKGEGVPQDLVEAYKWATIAARLSDPNSGDTLLRDLEGKLTSDQRAEAQRLAKEFVHKRTAPADP